VVLTSSAVKGEFGNSSYESRSGEENQMVKASQAMAEITE
jgi:hypothetical protein